MANSALQRKNMVESQVRPSDVTDRRITAAMQDVERERFVPAPVATLAYMDEDLNVAPGRSLMSPRVFARLLQLAELEATANVLIVGALHGYSAAVMSRMAEKVTALETDAAAVSAAKSALSGAEYGNVAVVSGPLENGWPTAAPFDVIFVEGMVARLQPQLLDQLAPSGKLVAVEASGKVGHAVVIQKTNINGSGQPSYSRRIAFDVSAPRLPGFDEPKGFAF